MCVCVVFSVLVTFPFFTVHVCVCVQLFTFLHFIYHFQKLIFLIIVSLLVACACVRVILSLLISFILFFAIYFVTDHMIVT